MTLWRPRRDRARKDVPASGAALAGERMRAAPGGKGDDNVIPGRELRIARVKHAHQAMSGRQRQGQASQWPIESTTVAGRILSTASNSATRREGGRAIRPAALPLASDDARMIHHRQPVGEGKRLLQVVGHQHRGRAGLWRCSPQLGEERGPCRRIEGAERAHPAAVEQARWQRRGPAPPGGLAAGEPSCLRRSQMCDAEAAQPGAGARFASAVRPPGSEGPAAALLRTRTLNRSGSWKTTEIDRRRVRAFAGVARAARDE